MKHKTSLGVAILSILCIAGCSDSPAGEAASTDTDSMSVTVALANSSCVFGFPTYVAAEKGFYADNGLDVTIQGLNGSAAVLQVMLANQAQIGNPGAVPALNAKARGEDIVFVANTNPGGSFVLVSPEDDGLKDAADLRGKTIGVATADGNEVSFMKAIMQAAGVEEGEYNVLVVGEGGQAVAGFSRGDIHAYAASMDGMATIEHSGIPLTDLTGTAAKHLFGNALAVTAEYLDSNPEAVQAYGRAYNQGREYGLANFDEVLEICEKYQPQEVEDPAYAKALFEATKKTITSPDGDEFGRFNPDYWERVVQDHVDRGEISEGQIDPEDMYTNEFVEGYSS
ncbi:ABC transporter substrate-binding protein [Arthrobacter sp. 7Tela_A1]|uniref:ABC transporter substrate-binding protein n=1 Tax=Arthrobacter sp. 7Tela_A1 TaxID=3093745 RepID=UPI003BB55730